MVFCFLLSMSKWGLYCSFATTYFFKKRVFCARNKVLLFFFCSCWLDYENGLIWAFAAPVLLVVLVNTAMFAKAILIARESISKKNINSKGNINAKDRETKNVVTLVKGSFSLLCILGVTWMFGFTYFFDGSEWLSVIFTILNSLQVLTDALFPIHTRGRQPNLRANDPFTTVLTTL